MSNEILFVLAAVLFIISMFRGIALMLVEKDYPKEQKKQTNADKYFRNATDEEIASFLSAVNNHRQWSEQTLMQDLDADYTYYLGWLKEETSDDQRR